MVATQGTLPTLILLMLSLAPRWRTRVEDRRGPGKLGEIANVNFVDVVPGPGAENAGWRVKGPREARGHCHR